MSEDIQESAMRNLPFVVTPQEMHKFVGLTAVGLALVLIVLPLILPICFMSSISHFYYTPVGGDVLVGALTVIGAIMLCFYTYKGDDGDENSAYSRRNARLAKLAGLCALGVAFAPTSGLGCFYEGEASRFLVANTEFTVAADFPRTIYDETARAIGTLTFDLWALMGVEGTLGWLLGSVHYVSAGLMFGILGYFSFFVFTRVQTPRAMATRDTMTRVKVNRNRIYRFAGALIFLSIAALIVKFGLEKAILSGGQLLAFLQWWNGLYLTFIIEMVGLVAFGVSWLVKARIFGWFEDT